MHFGPGIDILRDCNRNRSSAASRDFRGAVAVGRFRSSLPLFSELAEWVEMAVQLHPISSI